MGNSIILCQLKSQTHSVLQLPPRHCIRRGGVRNECMEMVRRGGHTGCSRVTAGVPSRSPPWPLSGITGAFVSTPAEHQLACRWLLLESRVLCSTAEQQLRFARRLVVHTVFRVSQETGCCGSKRCCHVLYTCWVGISWSDVAYIAACSLTANVPGCTLSCITMQYYIIRCDCINNVWLFCICI